MRVRDSLLLAGAAVWLVALTGAAAAVVWDGGGDGTNWNQALNWSGDIVPAATNDVVIDVAGTNVVIFISSGNISVRTLQCQESLTLGGGTFTVTAGASQIAGTLT